MLLSNGANIPARSLSPPFLCTWRIFGLFVFEEKSNSILLIMIAGTIINVSPDNNLNYFVCLAHWSKICHFLFNIFTVNRQMHGMCLYAFNGLMFGSFSYSSSSGCCHLCSQVLLLIFNCHCPFVWPCFFSVSMAFSKGQILSTIFKYNHRNGTVPIDETTGTCLQISEWNFLILVRWIFNGKVLLVRLRSK